MQSLLTEVFQGKLQAGQHLVTQNLAERFGVSHTPIREAFISLAGIGVIDLLPNRGAIVRKVTAREVREVCQVRRLLECEAARKACGKIDGLQLDSLGQEFRAMLAVTTPDAGFIDRARAADSRLHDLIASSCGNAFLAKELSRLKLLFRAFRDVSWAHDQSRHDFRRLTQEAQEHLAIVESLEKRDLKGVTQAMSRHIRAGQKYWTRAFPRS